MTGLSKLKYICPCICLILLLILHTAPVSAERPIPEPRGLVNDFANVIPSPSEEKIVALTSELLRKTGIALAVVTMPDIDGAEYNNYANRLYSAWGIGQKGEDKGVLIFVTIKERKMRIETGYGVEGILLKLGVTHVLTRIFDHKR